MRRLLIALAIALLAIAGCTKAMPVTTTIPAPAASGDILSSPPDPELEHASFNARDWRTDYDRRTAPLTEFLSGGPRNDHIPPITQPKFVTVTEANAWIGEPEPVNVVSVNGEVRAYPQQVLMWHEVVNDTIGGVPVLITFCPICNSASVYRRTVDGQTLDFAAAGMLRKSNCVLYDKQTESWWQELTGEAIVGQFVTTSLEQLPMQVVTWGAFKASYLDAKVLSKETGVSRPYGKTPYQKYDSEGLPQGWDGKHDRRVQVMERVVGVRMGNNALAVPYPILAQQPVTQIQVGRKDLVVFFQKGMASALDEARIAEGHDVGSVGVFEPVASNDKHLTFRVDGTSFVDNETGSRWNMLGQAQSGPLAGQQLALAPNVTPFWFAWSAFLPSTAVFGK